MHGQCDARPTVTFPAATHRCSLTGTKLYCFVNRGTCEQTTYLRLLPDSVMSRSRSSGMFRSPVRLVTVTLLSHIISSSHVQLQWYSIDCSIRYSSITIGCTVLDCSHSGKLLSCHAVATRMSDTGLRYSWSTLQSAGLLVYFLMHSSFAIFKGHS